VNAPWGRFADLADGGRRLAEILPEGLVERSMLVRIGAGGQVTGAAVAEALGVDVVAVATRRDDDGVHVDLEGLDVRDREVIVIDDGVETGTAAMVAGAALRSAGASRLVLAVPVCPRDSEASLRMRYDDVIAVTRPLVRRSLRWHYDSFA
jgi:predicted phosphoribosyltransferase